MELCRFKLELGSCHNDMAALQSDSYTEVSWCWELQLYRPYVM